jgi:microcompartment protein CcmL/EutN
MKRALGMIETKGLVTLFEATDVMLKSADVTFVGWQSVGSGMVTAFVEGDVAAVKISTDAGAEAAARIGTVIAVQVITRPHDDLPCFAQANTRAAARAVAWRQHELTSGAEEMR